MSNIEYLLTRLAVVAVVAIGLYFACQRLSLTVGRIRRKTGNGSEISPDIGRESSLDDASYQEERMANKEELQELKDAARGGFFRIRRYNYEDPGDKGTYYFELCAGGVKKEPVAISERYVSKSGAHRGIESVRRWALAEEVIEDLDTDTSRDGRQVPRQ